MMDLTAFMSHLYIENPLVSEPLSGLQGNLEAVLAKGSSSTFQSSACIGHFWRTQIHGNKMHVCHAFYFHQINGFYGLNVVLQSKISCYFVVLVTETRQTMNYDEILHYF